ncbi:ligand-binding sensor domain-containing protein [Pseudoflavitalea rhizosphaerae]|uniref:ligand-binding sensor domain-containing protein n=1 Tax=Pseudoflavitalea rhizosphaerae TaxID=1884793 RepID=UPI0013E03672|nr:sensor histidine kinase [Pseudoflavitalea rhizosphaerae]
MPRSIVYICVFLLFAVSASAQHRKYIFNRLSLKDGLASNQVYCIYQDKKGFMWFGTAHGLQRYDGRKTVMYRSGSSNDRYVPSSGIFQIFEDTSRLLWLRPGNEAGLFNPKTFRYKKAVIKTEGEIPPRSEYKMFKSSTGAVFMNITKYGILPYDPVSNTFALDSSRIRVPVSWQANTIIEDPLNGDYWIGCDSGLVIYRPSTREMFYRDHNPHGHTVLMEKQFHEPITALFIDSKRRCWITTWPATREQTFCFDLNNDSFLPYGNGLQNRNGLYGELHHFIEQSNGTIWAYGHMTLHEFDPSQQKFQFVRDDHIDDFGIKFDRIYSFYEDREQSLWLATDNGVFVFNPERQFFNTSKYVWINGKIEEKELAINAIIESLDGTVYAGSWGLGTLTWDANMNPIPNQVLKGLPDMVMLKQQWCIFEDTVHRKIWFGCQGGWVIIYDQESKRSAYYQVPGIQEKTIRQIISDKNGNIWLGSQYGHLVKWTPTAGYGPEFLKGFDVKQNIGTIIYKIVPDKEGNIWVCSHNKGLYKFNGSTGRLPGHYHTNGGPGKSLHSNVVKDIVQYSDSCWFVSTGVLNQLNPYTDSIRIIGTDQGLPSGSTSCMELDNDGHLWIGLMNGLGRYHPKRKSFTLFTQRDGLINGDFPTNASLVKHSGDLLFGNAHDIVQFNPRNLYVRATPLEVSITDFKLFNTYLPPDSIMNLDKVQLQHNQNSITIEFATLSYLQRDKTTYFYMLEGLDPNWIRADLGLYANYALLPPGSYTFKVMCRNADGVDSPTITTLRIQVEPPFYRTWWFISLLVLLMAGIIYMVHRFRLNRLLEMERVRTRIARDLHDDMGSTLSTINILSEMARMKVNKDAGKTAEYLNKISDNSSRMMEAMDDIVWSINPMNDSMQRITARMREFATGVLEARNIEFSFRVDDEVANLKLNMEERRDLFLVFKEAVNNLAKYSQCKNAKIELRADQHTLHLLVQDDGIGFNAETADNGNGLNNMRKRAQSLNGKLLVKSSPHKGSTVLLEVPLT